MNDDTTMQRVDLTLRFWLAVPNDGMAADEQADAVADAIVGLVSMEVRSRVASPISRVGPLDKIALDSVSVADWTSRDETELRYRGEIE